MKKIPYTINTVFVKRKYIVEVPNLYYFGCHMTIFNYHTNYTLDNCSTAVSIYDSIIEVNDINGKEYFL